MTEVVCPGWRASWINAWLAGVGATVLDERIRLSWTTDGEPVAVLSCEGVDPVEALVESWPTEETLSRLPIAEEWRGTPTMQLNVPIDTFCQRAQSARSDKNAWVLSSITTDLVVDKSGNTSNASFNPSVPGGLTLHDRLVTIIRHVDRPSDQIQRSQEGRADREQGNGLAFDQTRLGSLEDKTDLWIDPVVETLAFFGLSIFPVRGQGVDKRLTRSINIRARQRGWGKIANNRGVYFHWPAWIQPLNSDGIDALLDAWNPEEDKRGWGRIGVHAGWQIVPYKSRGQKDPTQAFGSRRL